MTSPANERRTPSLAHVCPAPLLTVLRVHFYEGTPKLRLSVRLWWLLCHPRYIHTTLEVVGEGLLFDLPYMDEASWYDAPSHRASRTPTHSITLISYSERPDRWMKVCEGWRTNRIGSVWYALTGLGKPKNCTTSVCAILNAAGIPADAAMPDDLWRQLSEQVGSSGPSADTEVPVGE